MSQCDQDIGLKAGLTRHLKFDVESAPGAVSHMNLEACVPILSGTGKVRYHGGYLKVY